MGVLESLDAVFRTQPDLRIKPAPTHFAGAAHLSLITHHGPLDVLGTVGRSLGYSDLVEHSTEMDIGEGVSIRVLGRAGHNRRLLQDIADGATAAARRCLEPR